MSDSESFKTLHFVEQVFEKLKLLMSRSNGILNLNISYCEAKKIAATMLKMSFQIMTEENKNDFSCFFSYKIEVAGNIYISQGHFIRQLH